jgi:hypothetical protein
MNMNTWIARAGVMGEDVGKVGLGIDKKRKLMPCQKYP